MIGIGAANLAAGLFQGFPVSTSGSRTAVAERSGAKTQLTGVTGAVLITVMIVLIPGLRNLPQPALAAVVITASLSLADIPGTVRLWRQRKAEFLLSIAAFLGVALLGVLPGIAIAVALSILNVFRRAWWPYDTELISLVFAELNGPVREKIERYGLTRTIDPRHFFPTVESAVAAFRQMTGAEWTAVGQATDDGTRPG